MTALNDRGLGMVHQAASGLCAAMCLYNLLRFCQAPNGRNGLNALVYLAGWYWEVQRTADHWRQA